MFTINLVQKNVQRLGVKSCVAWRKYTCVRQNVAVLADFVVRNLYQNGYYYHIENDKNWVLVGEIYQWVRRKRMNAREPAVGVQYAILKHCSLRMGLEMYVNLKKNALSGVAHQGIPLMSASVKCGVELNPQIQSALGYGKAEGDENHRSLFAHHFHEIFLKYIKEIIDLMQ